MHYWVSCAINKGGFFEFASSSSSSTTHDRDLKQPRRRAEWTPTGSVLTKPATSAYVSDVVHMVFRM